MKLLLHCCCAPCAGGCVERILNEESGRYGQIVLFFANSNLCDREEFDRRLASVKQLGEKFSLPVEVEPYDHQLYLRRVAGLENEQERGRRCIECFRLSLEYSAAAAERLGCERFCTSLTVSPHKNSGTLRALGEEFSAFDFHDFKKRDGFLNSMKLARAENFYIQNFCGCEFSRRKESGSDG